MNDTYNIYLISDSTGDTLDRIFTALRAQFEKFEHNLFHYSFTRTENQITKILEEAKKILISQKPNFSILGPVSAPMEKKASHYRGQLLLQSEGRKSLNQTLKMFIDEIERKKFIRRVKWSIDVDPIELF